MQTTAALPNNFKANLKDIGSQILEGILKIMGILGYGLFLIIRPILKGIFTFILGGVGLYFFLGIIVLGLSHLLAGLGHVYQGH